MFLQCQSGAEIIVVAVVFQCVAWCVSSPRFGCLTIQGGPGVVIAVLADTPEGVGIGQGCYLAARQAAFLAELGQGGQGSALSEFADGVRSFRSGSFDQAHSKAERLGSLRMGLGFPLFGAEFKLVIPVAV